MKDWTTGQRAFICAHLGVDMTGLELGRLFMVNPAEIHQVFNNRRGRRYDGGGATPTAFHSPGGGRLAPAVRGATAADAYMVKPSDMPWAQWDAMFDDRGFLKPEFL